MITTTGFLHFTLLPISEIAIQAIAEEKEEIRKHEKNYVEFS